MAKDYNKLKVVELKAELKRLGLPQNGLKADLVARLEEFESGANSDLANAPETATEKEDIAAKDVDDKKAAPEAEGLPKNASPLKPSTETATAITPIADANSDLQPSSVLTPLRSIESQEDSQKRKRRSITPPPADIDVRKRAKKDVGENIEASGMISLNAEETEELRTEKPQATDLNMHDAEEDIARETETAHDKENNEMSESERFQEGNQTDATIPDQGKQQAQSFSDDAMDIERDVEPSIHPATSALYIKNFMRPLRPQTVQDHLLDLATPAGYDLNYGTISNFYLDTIRTHAFVVFDSVSAASRVRTSLHNCVWPDETNRKTLWVDFIPPEMFNMWVDTEQSSGGGRGSTNRYEVLYDDDGDGNVTARLEECGAAPVATKPPPPPQQERKPSIPTGLSRGFVGIEGAPLGPRGFQQGGRSHVQPNRLGRMDCKATQTHPPLNWKPVSEELVERRLSAIKAAKAPYDRDFGKEYKRYFFENGDVLVDRGPEIFLGIRPPYRERERRREQQLGGERRRGGGGGGRRNGRRAPIPMPHGVPRGGDRYRGTAPSSTYDERPRYSDDRGGIRGGGRFRGDGYNRY